MRTIMTIMALAIVLSGAVRAEAAPAPLMNPDASFSATRILEAQGHRIEQRYFQRSTLVSRAETEYEGQQSTMIMRMDRNLMWIVMPQQEMYLEMSLQDPKARAQVADIPDNERITEFEATGRESVNGVMATHYRVASTDRDGKVIRGDMWISDGDRILVRMEFGEGRDRAAMELRDLRVGSQPDFLFEPPAGYRRMAMNGGLMGGLTGQQGVPVNPGSAALPGAQGPAGVADSDRAGEDPGFAEELATEVAEESEQAAKDEVRNTVRDTVRSGLKKIFGN